MKQKTAITPTRSENYADWYQNVIKASELADNSPIRGCMVIKPWGYALWENIVTVLDEMFKKTGVKNAYFPMFIPLSLMEQEASHIKGFAKECAVITHHRLTQDEYGKLTPAGPLSEPLIVRPTSETIIGDSFSKWIKSYRDLPVLINQWANVVRWEMRTRMFLRTSEFLWQEGHTAHTTPEEAKKRANMMLNIYEKLAEQYLSMPVIRGRKSESERFPGAIDTLCIEAMMQDRKALQSGTSHFLGQNFAKASNISFQTQNSSEELAWTTSWGVSTRLIGGIIMTHGDDNGIMMPPRVAPSHIVLLPIFNASEEKEKIMRLTNNLSEKLSNVSYYNKKLVVEIDTHGAGGPRNWKWIKRGIPMRVEFGSRDIKRNTVCVGRRDKKHTDKITVNLDNFISEVPLILDEIHNNMFQRAKQFRAKNTLKIDSLEDFYNFFTPDDKTKPKIYGGFALSHWCGKKECEAKIKKDLAVSIRCIPMAQNKSTGYCINCKTNSTGRVIFSRAY